MLFWFISVIYLRLSPLLYSKNTDSIRKYWRDSITSTESSSMSLDFHELKKKQSLTNVNRNENTRNWIFKLNLYFDFGFGLISYGRANGTQTCAFQIKPQQEKKKKKSIHRFAVQKPDNLRAYLTWLWEKYKLKRKNGHFASFRTNFIRIFILLITNWSSRKHERHIWPNQ